MSSAYHFVRDFAKRIGEEDLMGLAAELSYTFLLSLFPFLLFIVALVGTLATPALAASIVNTLVKVLPADAQAMLVDPIRNILTSKQAGLLSIGAIGALWGASASMQTIMKGLNATHLVKENRSFFKKTAIKLGLTLAVTMLVLLAASSVIGSGALAKDPSLLRLPAWTSPILPWAGLAIAFCLSLLGVALVYWQAPALEVHPFKLVTPGALAFSIGWVVGTALFGWYVANFASYNRVYGSIAGMIVLMVWMYWSGFLLLAGASLNALIEERTGARRPITRDQEGREQQPEGGEQPRREHRAA